MDNFLNKLILCFQDIRYAFDAGYPKHLHDKLKQRRWTAEMEKEAQPESPYHQNTPPLSFEAHKRIECASDCVDIKTSNSCGRHVVASTDVPVGSVIAVEEPFAKILLADSFMSHCFHCLYPSYNLVRSFNYFRVSAVKYVASHMLLGPFFFILDVLCSHFLYVHFLHTIAPPSPPLLHLG